MPRRNDMFRRIETVRPPHSTPIIKATRRALEFARAHGAARFLFTSSGAVYGKQPPEIAHISEEYPGAPSTSDAGSAYGQGKRDLRSFSAPAMPASTGSTRRLRASSRSLGPYLPLDANYAAREFHS